MRELLSNNINIIEVSLLRTSAMFMNKKAISKMFKGHILQMKYNSSGLLYLKIVSEYDQEIPQSQTADNPMAPRGRATQPSRDTRKTI